MFSDDLQLLVFVTTHKNPLLFIKKASLKTSMFDVSADQSLDTVGAYI